MKKLFVFSLILMLFSCKEDKIVSRSVEVDSIPVKVVRFEQLFYESNPSDLTRLKNEFPYFFPEGNEDTVWTNKLKDPLLRELYKEVEHQYSDFSNIQKDIEQLVGRIKYYYPNYSTPKVITLINEVDTEAKAVYADSLALVSLDCYLGEKHRYYADFPEYQRIEFNENQILPDLVESFSYGKISQLDKNLLGLMILYGKKLYLKDVLIPEYSDAAKIAYTEQQIAWCKENESEMWSYLIENKLLYDNNQKNEFRFIQPAPFSRFYLEIDNESPGRVGQWIGWQIVRSYMENNEVSLQDMLKMNAKDIFENSKYKPAK